MDHDKLVTQLLALLDGGKAHAPLAAALNEFPEALRGAVPEHLPYSVWQLLEHLRFTQRDILNFSAPPPGGYQSHKWPDAYWPKSPVPPTPESWDVTIEAMNTDLQAFKALLQEPAVDLFSPFAWGDGQNLLREALLIADHNSYHVGEIIVLRRLLGCWK